MLVLQAFIQVYLIIEKWLLNILFWLTYKNDGLEINVLQISQISQNYLLSLFIITLSLYHCFPIIEFTFLFYAYFCKILAIISGGICFNRPGRWRLFWRENILFCLLFCYWSILFNLFGIVTFFVFSTCDSWCSVLRFKCFNDFLLCISYIFLLLIDGNLIIYFEDAMLFFHNNESSL